MRVTSAIKYEVLRLGIASIFRERRSYSAEALPTARRYGEESKSNEMAYFAAIVARNKFPIAYSGFKNNVK